MDGNTIRRDQRTLYKLKQISRLIIINPWPALIIECRPNVHLLLLLLLFLFLSSSLPPPPLPIHSRERSHRENRLEEASHERKRKRERERERERRIFARCVRDNAPPFLTLSSQLRAQSYEPPSLPSTDLLCNKNEGGGGWGRCSLRVRRPIASSLTAINCQNVPHNSARANRGNLPSFGCESIDFSK